MRGHTTSASCAGSRLRLSRVSSDTQADAFLNRPLTARANPSAGRSIPLHSLQIIVGTVISTFLADALPRSAA